jgi:small subunit ribosomal protein S18
MEMDDFEMHAPRSLQRRGKVELDYKRPETLLSYMDQVGRIRPRRQTGLSAGQQRRLAREIKRARHLAFLPFVSD